MIVIHSLIEPPWIMIRVVLVLVLSGVVVVIVIDIGGLGDD